jgi:hypothetical protein
VCVRESPNVTCRTRTRRPLWRDLSILLLSSCRAAHWRRREHDASQGVDTRCSHIDVSIAGLCDRGVRSCTNTTHACVALTRAQYLTVGYGGWFWLFVIVWQAVRARSACLLVISHIPSAYIFAHAHTDQVSRIRRLLRVDVRARQRDGVQRGRVDCGRRQRVGTGACSVSHSITCRLMLHTRRRLRTLAARSHLRQWAVSTTCQTRWYVLMMCCCDVVERSVQPFPWNPFLTFWMLSCESNAVYETAHVCTDACPSRHVVDRRHDRIRSRACGAASSCQTRPRCVQCVTLSASHERCVACVRSRASQCCHRRSTCARSTASIASGRCGETDAVVVCF